MSFLKQVLGILVVLLGGVEDYALGEYANGLARLGRMPQAEADAFFARMSGWIGLDPKLLAQPHGRVSPEVFVKNLLRERNQVLDRYDGRPRLYFGTYPGGHMFYLYAAGRAELFDDVSALYR